MTHPSTESCCECYWNVPTLTAFSDEHPHTGRVSKGSRGLVTEGRLRSGRSAWKGPGVHSRTGLPCRLVLWGPTRGGCSLTGPRCPSGSVCSVCRRGWRGQGGPRCSCPKQLSGPWEGRQRPPLCQPRKSYQRGGEELEGRRSSL